MEENPYQSPQVEPRVRPRGGRLVHQAGTVILVGGLVALAYGAIAFWIAPSLPPNNGWSGRLPSLYVMGAGMAAALVGLALQSLQKSPASKGGIPSSVGFVVIVAIVVALIVIVPRLKA